MNDKGFTLIEVMVVFSLLMIGAMGSASMITNNQKAMTALQHNWDFYNLVTDIGHSILPATSCASVFSNQMIGGPVTLTMPGSLKLNAGQRLGALHIEKLNLNTVEPVPGTSDEFFTKLEIQVKTPMGKLYVRDFPVSVKESGGRVVSCSGSGAVSLAQVCSSVSGSFDIATSKCSVSSVQIPQPKPSPSP